MPLICAKAFPELKFAMTLFQKPGMSLGGKTNSIYHWIRKRPAAYIWSPAVMRLMPMIDSVRCAALISVLCVFLKILPKNATDK